MKKFATFARENAERKRRIDASTRVLYKVPFCSNIITGQRMPAHLFNKQECKTLYVYVADKVYVLNIKRDKTTQQLFNEEMQNKNIYYAIQYEDADGKLTQTEFRML